ncbi:MAG TPA: ABC transporter ATP-binding protein [Methylomirabilota bacterium]|nr:ABC transporter ATP-binding protein [Methylomirabilota bacterium]
MAHLDLIGVEKHYGSVRAVDRVSLAIDQGERLALLGPSGCGKTTTLNLVAGFLTPDAGEIRIAGKDVARLPPHKRNTGMVFQSYALFPHLPVAENVAFGLRMRRVERPAIARRVAEALALVRLDHLGARYPRQLSGGQQQRVALARALVIHPEILLLDEPLSNLDAKLRQEMRMELVGILKSVGITTIFVTHDQDEALSLADRVVVMNTGRIEQAGTPVEVYEEPATAFVAKFLGEPNVLAARVASVAGGEIACELEGGYRVVSERKAPVQAGDRVEVIVRAERVRLARAPSGLPNSFPARLEHVMYLGGDLRYLVRLGPHRLIAVEKNRGDGDVPVAGQALHVEWPARESLVAAAGPRP